MNLFLPLSLFFLFSVPAESQEPASLKNLRSADSFAQASTQGSPERRVNLVGIPFSGGAPSEPVPVQAAVQPDPLPPGPNLIFHPRKPGEPEIPLPKDRKDVETVRTVGVVAAAAGAGWLALAVATGAAFPVWGAALLFFGGLAAYMAHRNLK